MKKAQTMIIDHRGVKKINEGDIVVVIQGNFDENRKGLMVNHDWSFPKDMTSSELKSLLGGFLANVGDLYGDKFVAHIMVHAIEEREERKE